MEKSSPNDNNDGDLRRGRFFPLTISQCEKGDKSDE